MRVLNGLLLLLFSLCFVASAAEGPTDHASDIMRQVEKQSLIDSQTCQVSVDMTNAKGKVQSRSWYLWQEEDRNTSKLRIRFDAPAEMHGVTLLSFSGPEGAKSWLYTPSNRRLRSLAQPAKTERFLGTDLTQEDVEQHSTNDYSYQLIGEQEFSGWPVYKIKAISRNGNATQYSQTILYVRKDILATTFVEFYINGQLRKTMLRGDWKNIQGIWTPLLTEVRDVSRGSMTRIRAAKVQYHVKLDPTWFTTENLRKEP